MTDNEIIKALDILNKFDFFQGQRAGRELWSEKPTEVQNEDIKSFSRDVAFLKDLINRQEEEIDDLKRNDLPRCKDALRRANEIGMGLDKENQELKAEIEKLRNAKVIFETVDYSLGDLEDALKEVGRLKIENESLRMAANSFKLHYNTVRAEAIKEFADKLQEYLADHNAVSASYLSEFVKKLAKELTEGDSNAEITE